MSFFFWFLYTYYFIAQCFPFWVDFSSMQHAFSVYSFKSFHLIMFFLNYNQFIVALLWFYFWIPVVLMVNLLWLALVLLFLQEFSSLNLRIFPFHVLFFWRSYQFLCSSSSVFIDNFKISFKSFAPSLFKSSFCLITLFSFILSYSPWKILDVCFPGETVMGSSNTQHRTHTRGLQVNT